ncbi:MAG: hypothetical protein AAFY71_16410 [Bacteroidota bacterium]
MDWLELRSRKAIFFVAIVRINFCRQMYAEYFKEKFPQDEKNGLYKFPQLPAVRLGRILIKDSRIASPNDVIALHLFSGTFSSSTIIFTTDKCFYPDGSFPLEDVQEVQQSGSKLTVFSNQQNQFIPHKLSTKNEQVAKTLKRILEGIKRKDPKAQKMVEKVIYENVSNTELDWLNLRDEVMRTIDMLYERYNDGKLTLLEYESKKEELLSRL